ncbi:unnamed protein product [Sphagnum balticum]
MSVGVYGFAVITNWDAFVICVEIVPLRASETNLVGPIPGSASESQVPHPRSVHFLCGGLNAGSVVGQVVSCIAGDTVSVTIKGLALIGDRDADIVGVKTQSVEH